MTSSTITIDAFVADEQPQVQYPQGGGKRYLSVSLPVQRSRKSQTGNGYDRIGETTWYRVTFWEDDADQWATRLAKGTRLLVTGVPEAHAYVRRQADQNGNPQAGAQVDILFPTVAIIPKRESGQQQPAGGGWAQQDQQQPDDGWYPAGDPFQG